MKSLRYRSSFSRFVSLLSCVGSEPLRELPCKSADIMVVSKPNSVGSEPLSPHLLRANRSTLPSLLQDTDVHLDMVPLHGSFCSQPKLHGSRRSSAGCQLAPPVASYRAASASQSLLVANA